MKESTPDNQVEVKIVTANGKPFAVRLIYRWEPTHEIKQDKSIVPVPEFGAIAFNLELFNKREILTFHLKASRPFSGTNSKGQRIVIKATLRAEVWKTLNGQRKRLVEEWFASETPEGHETLPQSIENCLAKEAAQLDQLLAIEAAKHNQPVSVGGKSNDGEELDVREKSREVGMTLLRKKYPRLFKSIDEKRQVEEARKAYVADLWAVIGQAPDVANIEELVKDPSFTVLLSAALAKPGEVDDWKWELYLGWIPDGLHALSDEDLARTMNERTGEGLTPSAWRKRATRLRLVSSIPIGRPEKPNLFPPG